MTTLEARRRERDMVQTFKIVNGVDKVNSHHWFTKTVNRGTRGTSGGLDNLIKPRSEYEYRSNFFSQRVVEEWNTLPDQVKEARTRISVQARIRIPPSESPQIRIQILI